MQKKLIVIGGGAAGFFCAVNAAKMNPELKVILVEKSSKLLSKVKISGGGRCNTTHACFEIDELAKQYPRGQHFLKKAFHWFNTNHTIQWFQERGVELKTEADGRMFPISNTSQTIIDCLMKEANKYGVEIWMNHEVKGMKYENKQWNLTFSETKQISADFVCVACGGYPKSSMFEWLTELGHTIETPVPSLFTFNMPKNKITELMGVSVEKATIKILGTKLNNTGPVLITHWGLSGPGILKLSALAARELAVKNYDFTIHINWLPQFNEDSLRLHWADLRQIHASAKLVNKNLFNLPNRLWLYFIAISDIKAEQRFADLTSTQQNKLIKTLTAQEFDIKGKTTFKEEFVTCGGIKLQEVDVNTMQSKLVPQLYFAGEILDIDGITGGFNFQNAWTTGWIAAKLSGIGNRV